MVMSWFWLLSLGLSIVCGAASGRSGELSAAALQGAQSAVTLAVSMAGSLCLWSGVSAVMDSAGITVLLSRLLRPVLERLFPSARGDAELAGALSGNLCANLLGLGNAATPLGIRAARRLARGNAATGELCRLVVLNTASIQLIPTTVAAVRSALGCRTPFDLLVPVWITSLCAAALGLAAAWGLERVWKA